MSEIPIHWDRAELGDSVEWLEAPTRFSQSILWKLQEAFYQESGISAWEMVPLFVTNNPLLAQHYAKMIMAFVRSNLDKVDRTAPINIVELGAGPGRLTFLVLNELERIKSYFPELADLKLRIILTDFSQALLDYWLNNPKLKPFFENGSLDAAKYCPLNNDQIQLAYSGETLRAASMINPCIVMANYYFDTIPHDLFTISGDEKLQEVLVSPFLQPDAPQPARLNTVDVLFETQDVSFPYYDDPHWDAVLRQYDELLRPGSEIVFPTASLTVLKRLTELSPKGVAIITSDKGFLANSYIALRSKQYTDVSAQPAVFGLTLHSGAFSIDVNFHALKLVAEAQGGISLNTDQFNSMVHTAFLWFPGENQPTWQMNECRFTFYETLTRYNPLNALIKSMQYYETADIAECHSDIDFQGLMALFQASNYDPYFLKRYIGRIGKLGELSFFEGLELETCLDKMAANQYSLPRTDDCGVALGFLYRRIQRPQKAIDVFKHSIGIFGVADEILSMMALCYGDLGHYSEAIDYTRQALNMIDTSPGNENTIATLTSRILMWQELLNRSQPSAI